MTRFKYESVNFQFAGACQKAAVGGFSVIARHDPNHREPRGPCLFSHSNVWNSCLLLLQEFGYTLRAIGHPGQRDNPACVRWEATQPDRARLTGNTPIELLGLACLHRHFHPQVDEPYWWRMDGPLIVMDLIQEWQRRTDPTTIGDVNAP